jgi:hypothetical protein
VTTSHHDRRPLARIALAAGSVGTLIAAAMLARYVADSIGGDRGTYIAALLAVAVFGSCGLAHSLRRYRLTRPAPVRLPERTAGDLEPGGTPELIMPGLLG